MVTDVKNHIFGAVRVTEEGKGSYHSRVRASTTGVHVCKEPYKEESVVPSQQTSQWTNGRAVWCAALSLAC